MDPESWAVANFFLIDHSLKDASGHHSDYVQCIGQAANHMGFLTTLASNRRLANRPAGQWEVLKNLGVVRPVFRNSTYQPMSYLAGLRQMKRSPIDLAQIDNGAGAIGRWKHRFSRMAQHRKREKYIRQFAADCRKLFRRTLFTPNDHAFFTTVSELDLMGLAVFLSNNPRTMQVHWHLQFHFNLFEGRPPEYDSQSLVTKAVRSCFLSALARLSYHSINFYTTSDELANQYNCLNVAEFESLPYPIADEFARLPSQQVLASMNLKVAGVSDMPSGRSYSTGVNHLPDIDRGCLPAVESEFDGSDYQHPIKIVCPGSIRREKGQCGYLQSLVNEIWTPYLRGGTVQLVLQRPKRNPMQKPKLQLDYPEDLADAICEPVVYHAHPLNRPDYVELIKSADVGLLMYDSRVYYSRRAGILGELLACGKPVVVPAGSWLAEQIKEPIFEYADNLVEGNESRRLGLSDLRWESRNVPLPGGILSFDHDEHPFNFEMHTDPDESVAALYFDWHWPCEPGVYCRIDVSQFDRLGKKIATASRVVGHRDRQTCNALFTIDGNATQMRFCLTNAFHHSAATIKNVEIVTAKAASLQQRGSVLPLGSVGVIAADRKQLSECVREIVENLDHYRRTANEFSSQWYAKHRPSRAVANLIAANDSAAKIA